MARPGPVRPARPARWLAEAWLMRATCSDGSPDHGEWLGHARQAAIDHRC